MVISRYRGLFAKMFPTRKRTRYASLSLKDVVCLCAGPHDDDAWEEFVARVQRPISLTILRTASLWGGASVSLVEDLVQVTYVKLWQDNCRLLRDFAIQHPDAILGYVKKIAANATHDHFKHERNQTSGGAIPHLSTMEVDPEAGSDSEGSQEKIAFQIFLAQINEHLKQSLSGPDQERDRMIFWLYFRQGMSTQEIASLPAISLSAKGVGSVIDRLKQSVRQYVLAVGPEAVSPPPIESKLSRDVVLGLYGTSEYGAPAR